MIFRPWSDDETAYLIDHYATTTLHAIATALGRPFPNVQQKTYTLEKQGKLDRHQRFYHRPWSDDEIEWLHEYWGVWPDEAVAKHLNRTINACVLEAKRTGLGGRKMNVLTAQAVAEVFGVNGKTIVSWIERGWIRGKRTRIAAGSVPDPCHPEKKRRCAYAWNISYDSLETFVQTMPWAYDVTLMAEGDYLTRLAKQVAKVDPWLSADEAAAELGWGYEQLRRWIKLGLIPVKRRPKNGSQRGPWQGAIAIRKADLAGVKERHAAITHENRSASAKARRAAQREQNDTGVAA